MEEFRFSEIPIAEVVELVGTVAAQLDSMGIFQVREECGSFLASFQESVTLQRDETESNSSRNPPGQLRKHGAEANAKSVGERQPRTYQGGAANRSERPTFATLQPAKVGGLLSLIFC